MDSIKKSREQTLNEADTERPQRKILNKAFVDALKIFPWHYPHLSGFLDKDMSLPVFRLPMNEDEELEPESEDELRVLLVDFPRLLTDRWGESQVSQLMELLDDPEALAEAIMSWILDNTDFSSWD